MPSSMSRHVQAGTKRLSRNLGLAVLAAIITAGVLVIQPTAEAVPTPKAMAHTIDYLVVTGTSSTSFVTETDLKTLTANVSADWKRMSRGYITEMKYGKAFFVTNRPDMQKDFCNLRGYGLPAYVEAALGYSADAYRTPTGGQPNLDGRHLVILAKAGEIGCGWSGLKLAGGTSLSSSGIVLISYSNPNVTTGTLSHELGHVFGLGHSGSISASCVPKYWDGPLVNSYAQDGCAFVSMWSNYSDPKNVMGDSGLNDYDINGYQKYQLGLIQTGAGVREVTAQSTEQVVPITDGRTTNLSAQQSILLSGVDPDGAGRCIAPLYEIEYDSVLGGVRIYRVTQDLDCGSEQMLTDNRPITTAWSVPTGGIESRKFFLPGEWRVTQNKDMRIRVVSIDNTTKTATVGIQRIDSPAVPFLQVTARTFGFEPTQVVAGGGEVTAVVTTNQPGWTASSDQTWLGLTAAGTTGQPMAMMLSANTSTSVLTAVVTVRSTSGNAQTTVRVEQDGRDCGASLSTYCTWPDLSVPLMSSIDEIGDKDWFKIVPSTSGQWTLASAARGSEGVQRATGKLYAADGTTVLASDISDNKGDHQFSLTAALTAGQTYYLEVAGSSPYYGRYTVTATRSTASVSVLPTSWAFPSRGGQKEIQVTATGAWSVKAPSWVSVSRSSGTGSGTVTLTATANKTADPRSDVVTFSGGGSDAKVSVTQPVYIYVSLGGWTVLPAGESNTFQIKVGGKWTATGPSWATISPPSGDGDATVTVTVSANTTGKFRYDTVWFSCGGSREGLTLDQDATISPAVSVSPTGWSAPPEGGSKVITVTSNTAWTVEVPSWLSVDKSSGTGNGSVTLTAAANATGRSRSDLVTFNVTGKRDWVSVSQQSGDPVEATLTVSATKWDAPSAGGTLAVEVKSNTRWTVEAPSWMGVSTTAMTGNGTVTLTAPANTTGVTNNGYVTFSVPGKQVRIPVSQPSQAVSTLTVSDTSWSAPAGGGSFVVTVTSNATWTVKTQSWVTLSRASGTGNGSVTLTLSANTTGAARDAVVTFSVPGKDVRVSVSQPAQGSPPPDDCGSNTATTCGWTNRTTTVSGSIEKQYDIDWFRFVPPVSGVWTFVSSTPASGGVSLPVGTLRTSGGGQVASNMTGAPDGHNFKVTAQLTANTTYYFEVMGYDKDTGRYTVTAIAP